MDVKELKFYPFMETVKLIDYRDGDIAEANEFGCISISKCYLKANHAFAKYYIVYEDDRPIVSVMLQRDGTIIFFISKHVKKYIRLIRLLKRFARKTSRRYGPIVTKTASWYTEALRVNKLTGFKLWKMYNNYGLYVNGYDELGEL